MPPIDIEVLRFEIAKLQLMGGDLLVFRPPSAHPEAISALDMKRIAKMVPEGVQVWCIPQDVDMVVISPPQGVDDAD